MRHAQSANNGFAASASGYPGVVLVVDDGEQLLDSIASDRRHDPELGYRLALAWQGSEPLKAVLTSAVCGTGCEPCDVIDRVVSASALALLRDMTFSVGALLE